VECEGDARWGAAARAAAGVGKTDDTDDAALGMHSSHDLVAVIHTNQRRNVIILSCVPSHPRSC
jgi:hypothetical protein